MRCSRCSACCWGCSMSDYTLTTEELRAGLEAYRASVGPMSLAIWLAAHDAEKRAEWEAEEPESEYGWDSCAGFAPVPTPSREWAEDVIKRNPDWVLVRRSAAVPAGEWVPVKQEGESRG